MARVRTDSTKRKSGPGSGRWVSGWVCLACTGNRATDVDVNAADKEIGGGITWELDASQRQASSVVKKG